MKKIKRPKAFWGSLISAGIGIATNLISSENQKDALDELNTKKAQNELAKNSAITSQNLTAGYTNSQNYSDELLKRISYGGGGAANNMSEISNLINGISNGASTLTQGSTAAYNIKNTYLEHGMAGNISKKESIKEPDYKEQPQFVTTNNTTQVNNLPIKDKQNTDKNDLNNIRPTSVANSQYQFSPMQLFYLGGLNRKFCRR